MKKVLVVEDNRLERRIIMQFLASLSENEVLIDEVSEGAVALEYLSNCKYNLVITDLVMPNIEGLELISIMKQKHTECKIIAVSGSKPYYLHMAKKLGVDHIFTKPIDGEKFSRSVALLLNQN